MMPSVNDLLKADGTAKVFPEVIVKQNWVMHITFCLNNNFIRSTETSANGLCNMFAADPPQEIMQEFTIVLLR